MSDNITKEKTRITRFILYATAKSKISIIFRKRNTKERQEHQQGEFHLREQTREKKQRPRHQNQKEETNTHTQTRRKP